MCLCLGALCEPLHESSRSRTERFTVGDLHVPPPSKTYRMWEGWLRTLTGDGFSLGLCLWFLVDQAVLVFYGYHERVSHRVSLLVALAMVLYLDDDCL
jgi:hypothetical protein